MANEALAAIGTPITTAKAEHHGGTTPLFLSPETREGSLSVVLYMTACPMFVIVKEYLGRESNARTLRQQTR